MAKFAVGRYRAVFARSLLASLLAIGALGCGGGQGRDAAVDAVGDRGGNGGGGRRGDGDAGGSDAGGGGAVGAGGAGGRDGSAEAADGGGGRDGDGGPAGAGGGAADGSAGAGGSTGGGAADAGDGGVDSGGAGGIDSGGGAAGAVADASSDENGAATDAADASGDAASGDGGGEDARAASDSSIGSSPDASIDSRGYDAGFVCPPPEPAPPPGPDSVTFMTNVVVDTLAGGPDYGTMDGAEDVATLSNPVSVIVEPAGTLIECDFDSNRLRRVDTMGAVTTLTSRAGFLRPFGLGYGVDGSLYVDTDFNPSGIKNSTSGTIWRVDPLSGDVTVVAANLGRPRGFAAVPDGRLVLADYQNARVRLLDPATGTASDLAGNPACPGMADGQGIRARFLIPYGVAPLADGTFVVADYGNSRLRRITLDGQVTVFAGDGGAGTVDGPRLGARFVAPKSIVADSVGNVYVADAGAHTIRRVGADGAVVTVAGNGTAGYQDGPGPQAEFFADEGIAISADGLTLFVADGDGGDPTPYNRIRRITLGP